MARVQGLQGRTGGGVVVLEIGTGGSGYLYICLFRNNTE